MECIIYNLQCIIRGFDCRIITLLEILIQTWHINIVKTTFNLFLTVCISGIILFNPEMQAQTKTNLEVFYSLTDSLVSDINSELPETKNQILLTLNNGEVYSIFNNNIKSDFIKSGKKVWDVPPDEINIPEVNIVIESASVNYGEVFKDGWFGSYYTNRQLTLKGNYLQTFSDKGKQDFNLVYSDSILVDQIGELENASFPFTQGQIPSEPFLSGLAEPILAIGTAAAMVILFFSVRSK